jgi:hypothetical protein
MRSMPWRAGMLAGVALLLIGPPAAAVPVPFALVLTETSPGSAQYTGTFSIDSAVFASGKAFNLASIGIDVSVAGIGFTTPSPADSAAVLDASGLAYLVATFAADSPGLELALVGPDLEWDVLDGRDPIRSGTYAFSLIPEPSTLLLLAAGLAALRFRAGR